MRTNGRDHAGRFSVGHPGGPGRPRRSVEATYLKALTDACPPETWAEIVQKAVDQAREGDAAARAWLGKHLCGHLALDVAAAMDDGE